MRNALVTEASRGFGRALTNTGRGPAHFFSDGNIVANEILGRDTTWLDFLRAHHRAAPSG